MSNCDTDAAVSKDGFEKVESGVMVMKDGKAWGIEYEDGQCTSYNWIDPVDADIHNPEFCTKTTDVTSHHHPDYIEKLKTGKLVKVTRTIAVKVVEE